MKLLCPLCKNELILENKSYKCLKKHTFDLAKQGYLNLDTKNSSSGDNKEMISARTDFLEKDYYKPLKEELNILIKSLNKKSLLDLACGEGYYTGYFDLPEKYGIDISKEAIIQASKKDKTTKYIVSSIYNLPFSDRSFDIITTLFAPIAINEIKRVLKDDGYFIFVYPNADHLFELKKAIYDKPYLNEEIKIAELKLIVKKELKYQFTADNKSLLKLFKMTPYYYKTSKKDASKLDDISSLTIQASFNIALYQKILPIHT